MANNRKGNSANPTKWKDEFYLVAYRMAKDGQSDKKISEFFGVSHMLFSRWVKTRPALRDALEKARETDKKGSFIDDYVHNRLPKKLRKYWEMVMMLEEGNADEDYVWAHMEELSLRMKQRLWLHAFVFTNFNASRACQLVNVKQRACSYWMTNDPKFSELMKAVQQAKKDFFEEALIDLVKKGDTSAILFVNRTVNRDRGYNDKVTVDVSGTVQHQVSLEELDLPIDVLVQLKKAVEKKEQLQIEDHSKVLDAEFEVKEKDDE